MNFKFAILALSLAGALTACQTTTTLPSQKESVSVTQHLSQTLQAYTWAYQPTQTSKPIVLTFQGDRLSIHAGCNSMGTQVTFGHDQFKTGHVVGTMMACEPAIMQQEQFASSLLQNRDIKVKLDTTKPAQPILTVYAADGKSYPFTGTATPETTYQGQAKTIFLEISPDTKACVGVAAQQCMQVREIQYNEQGLKTATGEWQLFYSQIEGFKHDPKLRSIVRVKRFTIAHPAADQSQYAYVKDMLVEQELMK